MANSVLNASLKLFIGFALMWTIPGAAFAQGFPTNRQEIVWVGQAMQSCATWLASPEMKGYGKAWIGGFWTAANASNAKNHFVGHTTDAEGIFAEIEQGCRIAPSLTLMNVTSVIYIRFEKADR